MRCDRCDLGGHRPQDVPLEDQERTKVCALRLLLAPDLRGGVDRAWASDGLRYLFPVREVVLGEGAGQGQAWGQVECMGWDLRELRGRIGAGSGCGSRATSPDSLLYSPTSLYTGLHPHGEPEETL